MINYINNFQRYANKLERVILNGCPLNYIFYKYNRIVLVRGKRACSPEMSVSLLRSCYFEVRGNRGRAKKGIPVYIFTDYTADIDIKVT